MEQKQEKTDILKQMSSVVSHELRNPLAIISNSLYFVKTKLAAGGAALDPKIAKHIGIIESEVKHSNDVIEEMLAFTRAREMKPSSVSVNAALRDAASSYTFPPSVTHEITEDPADPCVSADPEALAYALRGLLNNAVQAMPEGGAVKLAASHEGRLAHFSVTDGGPGLPDGDGEKVFAPFFTTKPRGIGLGLTLARRYMEQLGGGVAAANAPGGGARVTLSLPLAD